MDVSFYKYGPVAAAYPHKVDAIGSLMQRLRLYANGDDAKGIKPGNTEYLMDAANFAMIEFMYPRHPDAYFKGTDDDASPGRMSLETGAADKRGNSAIGSDNSKSGDDELQLKYNALRYSSERFLQAVEATRYSSGFSKSMIFHIAQMHSALLEIPHV